MTVGNCCSSSSGSTGIYGKLCMYNFRKLKTGCWSQGLLLSRLDKALPSRYSVKVKQMAEHLKICLSICIFKYTHTVCLIKKWADIK